MRAFMYAHIHTCIHAYFACMHTCIYRMTHTYIVYLPGFCGEWKSNNPAVWIETCHGLDFIRVSPGCGIEVCARVCVCAYVRVCVCACVRTGGNA